MNRILTVLLAAAPFLAADFYAGCFFFRLSSQLVFLAVSVGVVLLHLLGVRHPRLGDPTVFLELAGTSETAMRAAGVLGALAALIFVTRAAALSGWRRASRSAAAVVAVAALAGAADLWFNVTPFVDRLMPPADFAAAESSVTV